MKILKARVFAIERDRAEEERRQARRDLVGCCARLGCPLREMLSFANLRRVDIDQSWVTLGSHTNLQLPPRPRYW
jgi:hypothetical protein